MNGRFASILGLYCTRANIHGSGHTTFIALHDPCSKMSSRLHGFVPILSCKKAWRMNHKQIFQNTCDLHTNTTTSKHRRLYKQSSTSLYVIGTFDFVVNNFSRVTSSCISRSNAVTSCATYGEWRQWSATSSDCDDCTYLATRQQDKTGSCPTEMRTAAGWQHC